MTFTSRFDQHRVYHQPHNKPLLCVVNPFDNHGPSAADLEALGMDENQWFSEAMGLAPWLLSQREDTSEPWIKSIGEAYGMPCHEMDVQLSGFVLLGEENEPNLYPLAVFECPETRERALFFPYAITVIINTHGEILAATRLD